MPLFFCLFSFKLLRRTRTTEFSLSISFFFFFFFFHEMRFFFFPTQLERNEWVTFQLRCVSCALPSDSLRTRSIGTFIDVRVEGWTLLATCAAVLSLPPLSEKVRSVCCLLWCCYARQKYKFSASRKRLAGWVHICNDDDDDEDDCGKPRSTVTNLTLLFFFLSYYCYHYCYFSPCFPIPFFSFNETALRLCF